MLTLRAGPRAAAVANAVTAAGAKTLMTGKPVSVEELERNVLGGVYLAKLGGVGGERWSNGLPTGFARKRGEKGLTKHTLGEWLALKKSQIYGDALEDVQVPFLVQGGKTRVDHTTKNGFRVEAKFGYGADLSKMQRRAVKSLVDYQVDHFTPRDIGNAVGGLLGAFGVQAPPNDPRRPR